MNPWLFCLNLVQCTWQSIVFLSRSISPILTGITHQNMTAAQLLSNAISLLSDHIMFVFLTKQFPRQISILNYVSDAFALIRCWLVGDYTSKLCQWMIHISLHTVILAQGFLLREIPGQVWKCGMEKGPPIFHEYRIWFPGLILESNVQF